VNGFEILESVKSGELAPAGAIERSSICPSKIGFCKRWSSPRAAPGLRRSHFWQRKNPAAGWCHRKGHAAQERFAAQHFSDARRREIVRAREEVESRREIPRLVRRNHRRTKHLKSPAKARYSWFPGTSDIPVAEEALLTARMMGNRAELSMTSACRHPSLARSSGKLAEARVSSAVAGMEGALPSVVGGLVAVPVIAVPTSVGYGASFSGVAALLACSISCASNVTVVNIDNGFGAACVASCINRLLKISQESLYGHSAFRVDSFFFFPAQVYRCLCSCSQ